MNNSEKTFQISMEEERLRFCTDFKLKETLFQLFVLMLHKQIRKMYIILSIIIILNVFDSAILKIKLSKKITTL